MKQKLWLLMLSAISTLTAWGAVGDTFTVSYPYSSYNSVTITYIVINEEEKECAIGTGAGVAYSSDVLYNFNIPSEVNGYTVTKINDIAFKNAKTLSTITIPETVKSIGNSAFYGCKANYMRELIIPDNVESIGTYCFGSMDVGKIIIGDGLVEIPEGAFYSCAVRNTGPNLTLGKNIKSIGDKAFYQASGINCILLPDEVVNIGEDAFYNVWATDVVLNSNLETIGQGAFQQIFEKTLTIPDKVQTISQDMFAYSRLEQLTLGKGVNQIMNYPFPESLKELRVKATTPPATTTYAFGFQYDIRTTTKLYVPLGTKSLYENTNGWKEFISIEEIDMPNPEETTPDPDSPAIDFADANVKALCVQYWDINGDGELSEAEAAVVTRLLKVFQDNKKITSFEELQYFTGLTELDDEEFYNCQKLQTIAIPANVTTIGDFAFQDCFSLSSIEIPNGVTTIGNSAFSYCNLSSVTIPASITSLTDNPFYGNSIENYSVSGENGKYDSRNNCNAIIETASNTLIAGCASTIIPSDIKSIGKCAFLGVKGLSTVNIPDGVERIADGAFGDCDDLASVTIPGSVTSIGSAFGMSNVNGELFYGQYCSLTSVRIDKETPLQIDEYTFFNRANATLYVPAGTKAAYEAADYWKEFGEIVEMAPPSPVIEFADANVKAICVQHWDTDGDGELSEAEAAAVTDLGEVFKENREITSFDELEYFTGLTDLGSAFETCTGLRSIVIPVNVVALDAVGNLASLESIRVVEGNTKYDSRNNCNAVIETETNKLVMGCQTTIIPEGITVIGQNAFWGRWGMREINFPVSLKTIDEGAFAYCISLNNIKLPSGLETIKDGYFGVFANCEGLKEVIVEWAEPLSIPANTFEGCDLENATLYVPYGTKAAYEAAEVWKEFGEIVEMAPESEPADIAEGIYLLKNADTELYLNKGNSWGMHAVLSEEGMPVRISQQEDGSYTLFFPYGSANQQMLFRDSEEGVYVDYNGQEEGCPYWTITHLGDLYYIQSLTTHPVYGQEVMPGTYLGNNPAKEASDQDGNALGVYNDVDGNVTQDMNIAWLIEPDGPHTAAQEETLSQLIATLQELDLDSSWAQSVLDNSASTYSEMFGAICDASQRIEQKQKDIAKVNKLRQELALLISSARMVDVETSEAQAVYDNGNAGVDDIRTAMNTLRAAYIERLGEGIDKSLVPLDVTSVISNASFYADDVYGWSYDNDMAPQFQSYNNAEYFQTAFDLHQTLTDLPNGSYVLRMKGFHRPGSNQAVFTEYQEGTNNASAELYANGESVVLQHQAVGARDNGDLGGAEVSYGDQTWYVPNSMQEARSWFDAEEGYFENELPVTVTDGTLTIGVRLGESVDEGWVIFDDFRLEYIPDNQLYVDETPSVLRGSKAELNISLRNAGAVSSTDFYLLLPAGMTIVNSAVSIAADRSDNHQVSALLNEEGGYYHIVCHSGNNSVFKENDGLLFSMTIACDESVAAGSYEGQMKNILMWDSSKVESSQPDFTFSIEVPEQQLGDVNADSRINVGDIMEVVDNIMRRPSDNFNFAAANLYYDKKINVFDLVRLINLVLRQPMTSNTLSLARRLSRMMSGEATAVVSALTIADFGINPGEQQTVDIELSNADHPYSLLEFELTLPEGVSLAKGQDGKWAVAPNSSRITSAHTITVEEIGQGQYKFLVYSTQNTAIEGSSGAIMTLTLTADADAPVGLQQGSITGQVLAEADEDGYEPADVSFSVNVGLLRGDANGDGRVSIADVVAVVDYITTNGNPTGQFVASAADTDGVEGITIADAVAIVNMIIGE